MDRQRYQPAVAVWNFSEADVYVLAFVRLASHCTPFQAIVAEFKTEEFSSFGQRTPP
jgi:hypothetical protein